MIGGIGMELKRLDETKVLKDPVHSYIHIHYEVIWNCLDSKEFQRLRRIRQLGGDFQVYPTQPNIQDFLTR